MAGERKPVAHVAGSALLVLCILLVENLRTTTGHQSWLTLAVVRLGFVLFLARALLAVRPLGPWLRARPAWARGALVVLLAALLFTQEFWAAVLVLAALLFVGGVLTAEFLDDVARAASPTLRVAGRPLLTALVAVPLLAAAVLAHHVLAQGLLLAFGSSAVAMGFGFATLGLAAGGLVTLGRLLSRVAGRARAAPDGEVLYWPILGYASFWFFGYMVQDALLMHDAARVPVVALAIVVVEFLEILFEAPERLAHRALPRDALWDVFLAVAFGALLLFVTMDIGGFALTEAVFGVKSLGWLGFVAGALCVPLWRWRKARRAPA